MAGSAMCDNLVFPFSERMRLFFSASALLIATSLLAQPGSFDPSFNPNDPGLRNGDGVSGAVNVVLLRADGKMVIGGQFSAYNGGATRLLRLLPDGKPDPTYNTGTGPTGAVWAMAEAPEDKLVIAGQFSQVNDIERRRVARLNADGSVDLTFDAGDVSPMTLRAVAVQGDGRVIVGGGFSTFNTVPSGSICRLNTDGSVDVTFMAGDGFDDEVRCIEQLPDGKLLVGGEFNTFDGTLRLGLCRLNADGSLDASFNPGQGVGTDGAVRCITVQPDGKILIGGDFDGYNLNASPNVARLNADGTWDNTFVMGAAPNAMVEDVALQANSSVLIAGGFNMIGTESAPGFARLYSTGELDEEPITQGTAFSGGTRCVAVQPDGRILVGGGFNYYDDIGPSYMVRLEASGQLDGSFNSGSGINGNLSSVNAITPQPDGLLLVGGTFRMYNNQRARSLVRIDAEGNIDPAFQTGRGITGTVYAIALQSTGKIIVGGSFTEYNGTARTNLLRLNADGTLDASFFSGTAFDGPVLSLAIQPDDKIIVGGDFDNFGNADRYGITRLNAIGNLDAGFLTDGTYSVVRSVALQPDGKILVGGDFTTFDGTDQGYMVRLNATGAIDNTLNMTTGFNGAVWSILVQPNNRILVGGAFTTYLGSNARRITRIMANGTADASFNDMPGYDGTVEHLALQEDGSVIAAGQFSQCQGQPRVKLARTTADGEVDATFTVGTSTGDDDIRALHIQPNNKMLLGTNATSYNGGGKNRLMRVFLEGGIGFDESTTSERTFVVAPNPAQDLLRFISLPEGTRLMEIMDATGACVLRQRQVKGMDATALPAGIYVAVARAQDGRTLAMARFAVAR